MKKTIILASLALMAAFSSCNKSEMPEAATTDGIKLDITVADLSPETKAVKKGWENGDRLNLYFEGWNEIATVDNYQKEPDMILKYDGSKWQIESQDASLSSRLKSTDGKFTALWESSNDLMNENNYPKSKWYSNSVWYYPSVKTFDYENITRQAYRTYMLVSSHGNTYTFDGSTLTANISKWTFKTKFKVLIKTTNDDVKAKAKDLVLQVKVGDKNYATPIGVPVLDSKEFLYFLSYSQANYIGLQGAVAESDGLAFYYESCQATKSDIVFTLIDTSNGDKKQYTVEGKDLTTNSFKAISIDYSKFKEGAADIPDGCVDLGLSVYWASCNLGASKPEEYGDYYAWGETEPYYSSQDPLTWKDGKTGYNWASYKWCNGSSSTLTKYNTDSSCGNVDNNTVLEPEDDVAHVKLGGKWRMPTDAEWSELRNTSNCSWIWTTINGVNGYKVQSKKSGYTDNWIFLPAAGNRVDTNLNNVGSSGSYWSSSLYTDSPDNAWGVYFFSGNVYKGSYGRCYGLSVRPVSE